MGAVNRNGIGSWLSSGLTAFLLKSPTRFALLTVGFVFLALRALKFSSTFFDKKVRKKTGKNFVFPIWQSPVG
jgi:hypothetical protein